MARIGVIPGTDPGAGGVYQYSISLIEALIAAGGGGAFDLVVVADQPLDPLAPYDVTYRSFDPPSARRALRAVVRSSRLRGSLAPLDRSLRSDWRRETRRLDRWWDQASA